MDADIDPLWVREFDAYVRTRGPRLLSIAHLLVDGREAAEDLYQEVLVKALLAWPRVRRADDIDAYLRRALVNTRASWWWRRRREVLVRDATEIGTPVTRDHADNLGLRDELARALARLSLGQRTAVVLRYYADLDERQVAAAMGCSVGTVRSQTARGLWRLRQALAEVEDPRVVPGGRRATPHAAKAAGP